MAKLEVTKDDKYNILRFTMNDKPYREIRLTDEPYNALVDYFKPKKAKRMPSPPPTLDEVKEYFKKEGYQEDTAIRFHKYYEALEWHDANSKPVLSWKGKAISSWFKIENKLKVEVKSTSSFFRE